MDRKIKEFVDKVGSSKLIIIGICVVVIFYFSTCAQNGTGSSVSIGSRENNTSDYCQKKEEELKELLASVEGVGKVKAMITLEAEGKHSLFSDEGESGGEVEGVVVVASGSDGGRIDREIVQAVQALFHVESHKIKVMKMQ